MDLHHINTLIATSCQYELSGSAGSEVGRSVHSYEFDDSFDHKHSVVDYIQ